MKQKFRSTKIQILASALLPVMMVLALACSTAPAAAPAAPAQPQQQEPPALNTAWQPTEGVKDRPTAAPSLTTPQQSAPSQAAPPAENALDPHAIVAAFEQVINGVHQSALPSVVNVQIISRVDTSGRIPGFGQPFPFPQPPAPQDDENVPDGDDAPQNDFFFRNGEGSGFVWSAEGHIVTNHHVIDNADRVIVYFADGTEAEAEVLGEDPDSDLAVLKVDMPASELQPLALGDSDAVEVGQIAITIGNPFSQEFSTTSGIVSAVGRTIRSSATPFSVPKVIQTDASINPGNSGGPLLNRHGEVIGINAQIISRTGGSAGIGFAIPINTAKRIVPTLIEDGSFKYSWLGIRGTALRPEIAELMDIDTAQRGAMIIGVAEGGPADDAGMQSSEKSQQTDEGNVPYGGDVIVAVNGVTIEDMDDLIVYLLENTIPSDTVTMTVIHDGGGTSDIEVTLGERPDTLE